MDSEAEINIINEFAEKGNFHAAMNIAISALNECRREQNLTGVDTFLEVINNLAKIMANKYGGNRK